MFFDSALPDLSNIESCNFVHKDLPSFVFFPILFLGRRWSACMHEFVSASISRY